MTKNHFSRFRKKSNILLTCEHASKRIPREYGLLGLTKEQLMNSKDWYDPGSLGIMRGLEKKIGASYIYSDVSRLVIDYNRRIDASNKYENSFHSCPFKRDVLVEIDGEDEVVQIPDNVFTNKKNFLKEERRRFNKYVIPYQKDGLAIANKIIKLHEDGCVFLIHSFYPKYNGYKRTEDIGVLFESSNKKAKKIITSLRKNSSLKIGANKPWSFKDADKSIFYQIEEEMDNVDLIVFDINNKHLQNKRDIKKMVNLIAKSLKCLK
jgi:predicted N-formylglutamate amidohydrolase